MKCVILILKTQIVKCEIHLKSETSHVNCEIEDVDGETKVVDVQSEALNGVWDH